MRSLSIKSLTIKLYTSVWPVKLIDKIKCYTLQIKKKHYKLQNTKHQNAKNKKKMIFEKQTIFAIIHRLF